MAGSRTRTEARLTASPSPQGLLLSTRRYTSAGDKLTVASLGARLGAARRIFLAAAFYDIAFCKALLAHAPNDTKSIRLVFNGLGGSRLITQRDELTKLERALRKRFSDVQVRLAFEPGIFHTKLLLIHSSRKQTAFVGSANATMAAMSVNEEILLEAPGEGAIESYAERIWTASTHLSRLDERLAAKSLVSFFRTGSLYFKPTTTLQTTINPFTELLGALPDADRQKLGPVTLPHSDQESGVGAFNLRRAAGLSDPSRDAEDRENLKASVKPYAVETCFGYWVPRAVGGELHATLQKVGAGKRARLLELRKVLAGC
jgi:PLD-like domain